MKEKYIVQPGMSVSNSGNQLIAGEIFETEDKAAADNLVELGYLAPYTELKAEEPSPAVTPAESQPIVPDPVPEPQAEIPAAETVPEAESASQESPAHDPVPEQPVSTGEQPAQNGGGRKRNRK